MRRAGATLHRGAWASHYRGLLLRSTGSRRAGSVVVAHGPSCSVALGIFPDQGSNPCPLHWQADSQPLRHQGSPTVPHFCADDGRQEVGIDVEFLLTALPARGRIFQNAFSGPHIPHKLLLPYSLVHILSIAFHTTELDIALFYFYSLPPIDCKPPKALRPRVLDLWQG